MFLVQVGHYIKPNGDVFLESEEMKCNCKCISLVPVLLVVVVVVSLVVRGDETQLWRRAANDND